MPNLPLLDHDGSHIIYAAQTRKFATQDRKKSVPIEEEESVAICVFEVSKEKGDARARKVTQSLAGKIQLP